MKGLIIPVLLGVVAPLVGAPPEAIVGPEMEKEVLEGVNHLLEMQEGPESAEWPYEGVYRVRGKGGGREIPIGYRVGGTGIVGMALIRAPGYAEDADRRAAVERATAFVIASIDHPLMTHEVEATYDVRGWGYTFGLQFLLELERLDACPVSLLEGKSRAIRFFLDGIARTSIPEVGGWNYSRRAGFAAPGPHAPFMTGPTLLALFQARAQGNEVEDAVVTTGLDALERARTETGAFVYSGTVRSERSAVAGAIGRMTVSEVTLYLAGRSDLARVRGALDAFIVHWNRLDERRAKTGTHARPFGVAPYYFYFAHLYAAEAIELLPAAERREYRRHMQGLLFGVQQEDGTWNDRVFERSASYGTAMAMLTLLRPAGPPHAKWSEPKQAASGRQKMGEQGLDESKPPGTR